MDTPLSEYITATAFAKLHGKSAQWICKLCQNGRIEGARKEGRQWMVDPWSRLPEDTRVARRAAVKLHIAELQWQREQLAEERKKEGLDDSQVHYTYNERKSLEAIQKGHHIDAGGSVWVRVADGTSGAIKAQGAWLKRVGIIGDWQRADVLFYVANGGVIDPAKLEIESDANGHMA